MVRSLAALLGLGLAATPLAAQIGLASPARTVVLAAVKQGSVRVRVPALGVTLSRGDLVPGLNDFSPVAIETAWDLDPARTAGVSLVAYFETPSAALAGPGVTIPSGLVYGRMATGGVAGFAPFTGDGARAGEGAAGRAGGSLVLFTEPVAAGAAAGARSDRLEVRVDLTGWTALPAGEYRGALNLLAITQ